MLRSSLLAPLVAVLVLGSAASATAQERDFDFERWSPAPDGDGFLSIPGTRTPGPWRWNVGFALSYAREPMVVNVSPRHLVSDRLDGNLFLQLGILGQIAVTVNAPVALFQSGAVERIDGGSPLMIAAIRDPRIAARVRVLGEDATLERDRHEGEGIALQAAVTLPIGHTGTFAGEGAAQLEGAMIADFHILDIGVGGILGFRHRFAEPNVFGSSFRNQIFGALGVQVPLFFVDHVVAIAELDLTTDAENPFGDAGSTAAEWRFGFRVSAIRDVELTLAGGTGLVAGAGAPVARGILGVSWAPRVHDRDQDGIVDDADACQTLPEDFDANEDDDGCPEPDNDHDLVPDLDDRCPNEAAIDGRDLDDDGCTDPFVDTDGDGLDDPNDRCPGEAEDRDGHADDDGCPDPDDDGDGVPDGRDRRAGEPGDRDGNADDDGCPDPDDDGDGVLDTNDRCPGEVEDRDGVADDDGCIDLDDDHDGVIDARDACVSESEDIDGVEDIDGCPERGGRSAWTRERAPTPAPDAPPVWLGVLPLRGEALAPQATATIAQLAHVLVSDAEHAHVIDVGLPEQSEATVAALSAALRTALDQIGATGVSFLVRRSAELGRGRARVLRLLGAGRVVAPEAIAPVAGSVAPPPT